MLSDTQLGMLISIVNIMLAVLVIPSAYFIDHWSRKKMIALMGGIWSLATGACAFAGGYWHMLMARFFIGAGEAGYNPGGTGAADSAISQKISGNRHCHHPDRHDTGNTSRSGCRSLYRSTLGLETCLWGSSYSRHDSGSHGSVHPRLPFEADRSLQ